MKTNGEVYLDASVLVALLTNDAFTARADAFVRTTKPVPLVSDFAAAEFASAIARRVRMGEIAPDEGRIGFASFDTWTARARRREQTKAADVAAAEVFLRRLDLVTFDEKMAANARLLGTPTEQA